MSIELADIQLPRIHRLSTVERADFASHRVPGLSGNLVQDLGRASVVICIEGIFYGPEAADKLDELRAAYKNRQPVDFLADIVGQSYFSQVVIEQLEVWQRAGEPEQFSYNLLIREYVPPPQPATTLPEDLSAVDTGILEEALGFMDALALPDLLSLPNVSDPTPPLATALEGVESALSPLEGAASGLGDAAGPATDDISGLADAGSSDIAALRDGQVGALSDGGAALSGAQPGIETGVQGVNAVLNGQTMPAVPDPSPIREGLADAGNLLPTDTAALTAPLTGEINGFFQQLNTDLAQPLSGVTARFGRIGAFTSIGDIFSTNPPANNPESAATVPFTSNTRSARRGPADPTPLETALSDFSERLDIFPNPLTVESLFDWLYEALRKVPREKIPLRQIPIFDELRDKLETLRSWEALDAPAFQAWFAPQLQTLKADIHDLFAAEGTLPVAEKANTLSAAVRAETISSTLDALLQGLPVLAQKTTANELVDVGTDIAAMIAHVEQLRSDLAVAQRDAAGEDARNWLQTLDRLPLRLEVNMLHLLTGLQPISDLDLLRHAFGPLNEVLDGGALIAAKAAFEGFFQQIRDLLAQLDLSAIRAVLDTVIGGATDGLETLRTSLLSATLELAALLDQVEQAVRAVPTDFLVNGLRDGLNTFRDIIESGVAAAFDVARQLIVEAFNAIEGFLGHFNPAALLAELERILSALRNILESNELQGGIRQFKGALNEANNAIGTFSFRPIADVVVEGIHAVEQAIAILRNIPLTQGMKDEIKPAIRLLPASIDGPVSQLEHQLDTLLEDQVIPALNEVQAKLTELLAAARGFSPEAYFTTYLVAPYEQFLTELNNYQPSTLLAVVQVELDRLKHQLRAAVNLEALTATLDEPFAALFERFDTLRPEAFIEGLEQEFQAGIRSITDALPLDTVGEAFNTIEGVVTQIQQVMRQLTAVRQFLTDLHNRFGTLADARAQFEAVGDRYSARLNDLGNMPGLNDAAQELAEAVQNIHSTPLLEAIQPAAEAFLARLRQVDAKAKLIQLVSLHRAFPRQQLNTLPDSPEKTSLITLLDGFNPMHRDFVTPANELDDFADDLETVLHELPTDFTPWDARWFAAGSPLNQLLTLETSASFWQNSLRDTLRAEFTAPLAPMLGWVEYLAKFADGAARQLAALLGDVEEKVNDLLEAANRIQELRIAFDALINTLENFDFSVVGREVGAIFGAVRDRLNNIRPRTLLEPIQQTFDELLNFLELDQLLGANELDEHFQRIHGILESANPANVLPGFTQLLDTIRVRIDDLDITAQIAAFGQSLLNLKQDLNEQLDRTVIAYDAMYEAIPADVK